MQKYLYILLFLVFAIACGSGSKNNTCEGKKVLTVTIDPQRFFLEQIVGDLFSINTLVPPGTSPETYEPAPSMMVALGKSEAYFMVGNLGFENAWSERLAENNPDVSIINCSDGVNLMEGHGECDGHDHDHAEHHDHHHAHGGYDPHIWSSPVAVKAMAGVILEAVVGIDPDNKEVFNANYTEFMTMINRTDSLIRDLLENAPSKSFIIYHPSLGYFARDYGLHQHSIEFEGKNPSPSQIKELVDLARKEKINTVFIQRGFDMKNAEVVAREIGAEVFEIDPLAYDWDKELLRIATILARDTDE